MDNGTQFKSQEVQKLYDDFEIKHFFLTPRYPKSNDQA